MTTIIFATTNEGKLKEVEQLINIPNIKLISLNSFKDTKIPDVEESGVTFLENALLKARTYFSILKSPLIADDSGLVVPALNNEPGVFSSRYAGPKASYSENNSLLLKNLASVSTEKRDAYFQSVIVYKDKSQEKIFEGKCYGRITQKPFGKSGFGYDPIFYFESLGKTFAQLKLSEKNRISHRGNAVKALVDFLKKLDI